MIAMLSDNPIVFIALAALIGLFIGSFLNVVVHRLPQMMNHNWQMQAREILGVDEAADETEPFNLVLPRSRCPHCGHLISALENIPVVSYLFLNGKCRHCRASISARYPAIEILTALLSAYAAWHFGPTLIAVGVLVLIWILVALTFIDLDTQLLPDDLTLPLLWFGLAFNLITEFVPLTDAVIGAMVGYLSLWSVYWLFKLVTGKEGMGYGDFKLLAALGAWLGWQSLPLIILLSSLVGAIFGVGLMIFARHGKSVPIPFGPYLAIAGIIALFWGQNLTQLYLSTF